MSALIVATPSSAYASDGFIGGLQDLVGVRDDVAEVDYEREYIEEYGNGLRADPPDPGTNELIEIEEGQEIQAVVDRANAVPWGYGTGVQNRSLVQSIPLFFTTWSTQRVILTVASGLVFVWWGVRKCIQMVMSSFRKGSMNV